MRVNTFGFLFVVSLLAAPHTKSAELVQFQAGQAAKAAEVNANFTALNNELAALKSFNNLSAEQISALKAAITTQGLRWTNEVVDCTENPHALMEIYSQQGAGLVYMGLTLIGDCYASLTQQFHGLTLSLRATPETPARLLPEGTAWSLSGGFNGGLYLSHLTLLPPTEATGVLYSRVSQGSIDNVIIEGGGNGVMVQAGAQTYLTNVQIKNTKYAGIRVTTGGNVRIANNIPDIKLVDTSQGTGLWIEQSEVISSAINIRAPQAIQVMTNGSMATNVNQDNPVEIVATGNIQLSSGGQFQAQKLTLVGNLSANQSTVSHNNLDINGNLLLNIGASLYADAFKIVGHTIVLNSVLTTQSNDVTGKVRAAEGGSVVMHRGMLKAVNPTSQDYQASVVLELSEGATGFFGNYDAANQDVKEMTINGQSYLSLSTFNGEWVALNGGLSAQGSKVRLNNSTVNAPGRSEIDYYTVSLNSGSVLEMFESQLFAKVVGISNSRLSANKAELGTSRMELNINSSAVITDCDGSGFWNLDSSAINLTNCELPNSALFASLGSNVRMWGGQFGLAHLDFGSNVSFTNMTLTGNGAMGWGDTNYVIGANSMLMLDKVNLDKAKVFHNNGTMRIASNSAMAISTIVCSARGYMEWWTQTTATLGSTGSCNVP